MTTLGIHQERLELRLADGLIAASPSCGAPSITSGSTVLGRALLLQLQSRWPDTQASTPQPSQSTERKAIREKARLPDHCMDSVLSQYLNELTDTVTKARERERQRQAELQESSEPKAPASQPKPTLFAPAIVAEPLVPNPLAREKSPVTSANSIFAPSPVPGVEPTATSGKTTEAGERPAAQPQEQELATVKLESQTPVKAFAVDPSALKSVKLNKTIQNIVKSSEYQESLQVRELLCIIAMEAEGLPKKLARTMSSMAEQKNKLEKTLWKLRESGWATQTPALIRLSQLIRSISSPDQVWPENCDSVSFVFLNELLKNLVKAYLSQAHQASTVWSFSHFVALLLRSDGLKSVVAPLWQYNIHAHTCAALGIWDRSAYIAEAEHVVRLHLAVLICEPNFDAAWTYLASLSNDISLNRLDLEVGLSILNAALGVSKVFIAEHFPQDWPKLESVLRTHILPMFKRLTLNSEKQVRLVQLEEALRAKTKPEAYSLSAREKELTID